MSKIVFIGAGSTVFAKTLLGDILSFPELADSTITLMDIDEERLRTSTIVAQKIASRLDVSPRIESTADRGIALQDADYVLCMIQVGSYKLDFDIPKKYGLRQTIADTLGIGGIMRALRTIPVLLDIVADMERLCPDAIFINFVNPMAMNQWAISRASSIKTVGLCHSVYHTALKLSQDINVPLEDISYHVAGINHMAFYLNFQNKHTGEDLYPLIHQVYDEGRVPEWNRVRYDLFKRLGYFVTESSEHLSEYVPWYIKNEHPELIEQFNIPLDEYLRRCQVQIDEWQSLREHLEDPQSQLDITRSPEYGADIIHSMETNTPCVIYGNVPNANLIHNLPGGCCVELPCLVDRNGIQPTTVGDIPPQLAALMQTNINVQSLTVEAALTRKREYIYQSAMFDPHTAAELTLDQIWAMVDDLIAAHGDYLPAYH
jgi:alpha-galactosidase